MLFHLKTSGERDWAEVPNFEENILTDIDSPNLVIPSDRQILQERSEYKIRAVVTLDNGLTIAEEMAFVTNSPPHVSDGRSGCSVTPSEGIVLTTEFNISCSGWTDDDLPLNYEFRLVVLILSGEPVPTSSKTNTLSPTQSLPDSTLSYHVTQMVKCPPPAT